MLSPLPSRIPVKVDRSTSPHPALHSDRNVNSRIKSQSKVKRKDNSTIKPFSLTPAMGSISNLPKNPSRPKLDKIKETEEMPIPKSSSCAANFPSSYDSVKIKPAIPMNPSHPSTNIDSTISVDDKLLFLIPQLENWATNSSQVYERNPSSNGEEGVSRDTDQTSCNDYDNSKGLALCFVPPKLSKHACRRQPSYATQGRISAQAIPLGMKNEEEKNKAQKLVCLTNRKPPQGERRIASVHGQSNPTVSPNVSRVPSHEPPMVWRGTSCIRPKTFYSSTYEGMFYRKKAFDESKGPEYLHSSKLSIKSPSAAGAHFHAEHKTVLTKVFTETNYEYEDRDESDRRNLGKNTSVKKTENTSKSLPTKTISGKSIFKGPTTVAIKDPPSASAKKLSFRPETLEKKGKICSAKNPKCRHHWETSKSGIPRLILPGHGDPHLESPNLAADRSDVDVGEKNTAQVVNKREKRCRCKKCKVYKNLLRQRESTVKYLTQMLTVKDQELQNSNDKDNNRTGNMSKGFTTTLNPLLKKSENAAVSSATPIEKPCAHFTIIPQFDLDEFIRKYFKHALLVKDFATGSSTDNNNNDIDSFGPLKFYRVAVAARDCMAQIVKHKLKYANDILGKKYDMIASMNDSLAVGQPLDASVYFSVLDSYRDCITYIYNYWRESIKKVESFERACIPQNQVYVDTKKKSRIVYWYDTQLTIDGTRYSGTFIPFRTVAPSEDGKRK